MCPLADDARPADVEALRSRCASLHTVPISRAGRIAREVRALLTGRPRMAAAFVPARLERAVERVAREQHLDAVLVSTLHAAEAARRVTDIPRAIDLMDAYSDLWRSVARTRRGPLAWAASVEAARLSRYEAGLLRRFDRAIVVSRGEAETLSGLVAGARIEVVGNGVDLEAFQPPTVPAIDRPPVVAFVGSMDYFPNADAVRYFHSRIWPAIRDAVGEARFHVVGRRPTRGVRALAADPHVLVTGAVPDVRPYLARAAVAVAPLRIARGVQNKVLEALAMGVPVVASSCALAGLDPDVDEALVRADDPARFAGAVLSLLADPERRRDAAARGRRYVEARHRWADQGARLLAILHDMIAEHGSRRAPAR